MLIPVIISALGLDSSSNNPVVILKEIGGKRTVPIWIGILEASAIASELEGVKYLRPMTHDLLTNILESMDVKVNKVEVCDLKENTYYALIHMTYNGKKMTIDARPSDALALSLRIKVPIFISDDVINRSPHIVLGSKAGDKSEHGKDWQEILENLDPEDFGNT
ncbi:MAG: bifunctional nuclease family protein [Deltaproteobacteria bacterium]|nr:bifunctional nuclease family protein [Deltaproteobacteria bacterium]